MPVTCFRPDHDVPVPGDLPPVLGRPGQPDLDVPGVPDLRELHKPGDHPAAAPRQLRAQRLHPRAARHHHRQPGQARQRAQADARRACPQLPSQDLRALRRARAQRGDGDTRGDRAHGEQGGHRRGQALPRPRDRGPGGGARGPGDSLPAGGDKLQQQRDHQDRGPGGHQDDLRVL